MSRYDAMAAALDADIALRGPIFPNLPDSPDISGLPPRDTVLLSCGADITPEAVRWLWANWLAKGKLHILAGAPGQGKTTLAVTMGATVTIGGALAGWEPLRGRQRADLFRRRRPGRYLAAPAHCGRWQQIPGVLCEGCPARWRGGAVRPARDMQPLKEAIDRINGIKLLIVDPVVSAVTGDSHKNTEVRRALQPLVDLASMS